MSDFKPINRWPHQNMHLRNIEMSLEVMKGKTYKEVGKIYNLSANRVMQVCRILAAKLYERYFDIPYLLAFFDKSCYAHKDMKNIVQDYHQKYIAWMTDK